jgi:hypothetical protein
MPRFGTRSLLIGFAVIALWLSTLTGYEAGSDVRAGILLVGIFAAAFAAIYTRGSRQAIWIGFVGALPLMTLQPDWRFVPKSWWANRIADRWAAQSPVGPTTSGLPSDTPGLRLSSRQAYIKSAIIQTVWAAFSVPLSAVVGLIGASIHNQYRKSPDCG